MSRSRSSVPGIDAELLAKDTAKLLPEPTRRAFLRAGAGVGALAFLTGCDIIDGPSVENALRIVSRFNDRVQAWLFNPNRLAPTYPETAITRPFPFNAYYREENAPDVDEDDYKLLIDGLVDDKRPWTLDQLYALPQETQITRLVCVEGWSAIGKWTGSLAAFELDRPPTPVTCPASCPKPMSASVMSAVLTAGQSPPIYPQLRTHRCTALTDGMRHFRTFLPHK